MYVCALHCTLLSNGIHAMEGEIGLERKKEKERRTMGGEMREYSYAERQTERERRPEQMRIQQSDAQTGHTYRYTNTSTEGNTLNTSFG